MAKESQQGFKNRLYKFGSERPGGRWVRVLEGTEGYRGRDFDVIVEIVLDKSVVEVFHGEYEVLSRVMRVYKDFVAHSYGFDLGGGVVSSDVLFNPGGCEGLASGCSEKKPVGEVHGNLDSGSG